MAATQTTTALRSYRIYFRARLTPSRALTRWIWRRTTKRANSPRGCSMSKAPVQAPKFGTARGSFARSAAMACLDGKVEAGP